MKAILQFDLPDESEEHKAALNGREITMFLSDFYNNSIRARLKHGDLSEEQDALLEEVKKEFIELFGDWI
jgi:hypothetical protein